MVPSTSTKYSACMLRYSCLRMQRNASSPAVHNTPHITFLRIIAERAALPWDLATAVLAAFLMPGGERGKGRRVDGRLFFCVFGIGEGIFSGVSENG